MDPVKDLITLIIQPIIFTIISFVYKLILECDGSFQGSTPFIKDKDNIDHWKYSLYSTHWKTNI